MKLQSIRIKHIRVPKKTFSILTYLGTFSFIIYLFLLLLSRGLSGLFREKCDLRDFLRTFISGAYSSSSRQLVSALSERARDITQIETNQIHFREESVRLSGAFRDI